MFIYPDGTHSDTPVATWTDTFPDRSVTALAVAEMSLLIAGIFGDEPGFDVSGSPSPEDDNIDLVFVSERGALCRMQAILVEDVAQPVASAYAFLMKGNNSIN